MSVWEFACCIAPRLDTDKESKRDPFEVFDDVKMRTEGIKGF